jgi:GxxExxY protein
MGIVQEREAPIEVERDVAPGSELLHGELTGEVISAFYAVYNELGHGFLERIYEAAMALELKAHGLRFLQQAPIRVIYRNACIGEYFADFLVERLVVVELKSTRSLGPEHSAQVLNYLKSTRCEVGLLLNFGPRPEIRRLVFDNDRKGTLSWAD